MMEYQKVHHDMLTWVQLDDFLWVRTDQILGWLQFPADDYCEIYLANRTIQVGVSANRIAEILQEAIAQVRYDRTGKSIS